MHRLLILLVSTLLLTGCARGGAAPATSDVVSVRVAPVDTERLAPPVAATGVLAAKEEVALGFKVGGVIARVLVDEGRAVRAGDTLAVLDLSEIDAGVTRARSGAEKADRDLARARRLYADSVATLEQVQNAATGADVARAELDAAAFNRRHAVIIAPAGGTILRRQAEPGELVTAGTTILTLGSRARGFVVRAGLADRDVVRVRRGDSAEVRFDAVPGRTFRGTVTEIAGAADAATGTYAVEVRLPGPDAASLPSGLVAELSIRPVATGAIALIPIEAVLEADGTHAVVFALSADGRRAERRQVSIAFLSGDRVAVAAGLNGVRAVITDGAAYLDDGAAVRVLP
jgi:RND family efflux transporter MFP subunit